MLKNIVLLVDNLVCAHRAAKFTAELAKPYRSRVTVLYAYKPAPENSFSTYFLALGSDKTSREARAIINKIVTHLNQLGVETVDGETRAGSPSEVLQEAIHSKRPDLIVLGSCGELLPAGHNLEPVESADNGRQLAPILIV